MTALSGIACLPDGPGESCEGTASLCHRRLRCDRLPRPPPMSARCSGLAESPPVLASPASPCEVRGSCCLRRPCAVFASRICFASALPDRGLLRGANDLFKLDAERIRDSSAAWRFAGCWLRALALRRLRGVFWLRLRRRLRPLAPLAAASAVFHRQRNRRAASVHRKSGRFRLPEALLVLSLGASAWASCASLASRAASSACRFASVAACCAASTSACFFRPGCSASSASRRAWLRARLF